MGRAREVSRAALLPFSRRYAEAEFGLFKVTSFLLFSSVLAPHGAIHSIEMRYAM